MSKNNMHPVPHSDPTPWQRSTPDGLFIRDPLAWVYRVAPNEIIAGADAHQRDEGAQPLRTALSYLAEKSRDRVRRYASKNTYRPVHILSVAVPSPFHIPPGRSDLAHFASRTTTRRVTFIGTPLVPKVAGAGPVDMIKKTAQEVARVIFEPGEFNLDAVAADLESVEAMMAGARLRVPTRQDRQLIQAWWNWGRWADTPYLPHADHLHVFVEPAAASIVQREPSWLKDCSEWAEMQGQHALSFASVYDWSDEMYDSLGDEALWASRLFAAGAVAVSIRGLLEPARVTRKELSVQKKRIVGDIEDRSSQGKLGRVEEQERLQELSYAEELLAGRGADPTLTDAVVTVAFSGLEIDWEQLSSWTGVRLKPLDSRQRLALTEVQPCSPVIANPHRHDLSLKVISHSGLTSLSKGGDEDGALLGFTSDNQPSWVSPVAASATDAKPILTVLGATRSGKALTLREIIPIPVTESDQTGWTTMGELRRGDLIYGRNGQLTRVLDLSPINPTPELHHIHLDDGQVITACVDHRWTVSSFTDRHRHQRPKRQIAADRWHAEQVLIDRIERAASSFAPHVHVTLAELVDILVPFGDGSLEVAGEFDAARRAERVRWTKNYIADLLRKSGCPSVPANQTIEVFFPHSTIKRDPAVVYPLEASLRALLAHSNRVVASGGTNQVRWGDRARSAVAAVTDLLDEINVLGGLKPVRAYGEVIESLTDHETYAPVDLVELMESIGADQRLSRTGVLVGATAAEMAKMVPLTQGQIARVLRDADVRGDKQQVTVVVPRGKIETRVCSRLVEYPAAVALKSLASILADRAGVRPEAEIYTERVLTTGEMLAEGVRCSDGRSNFSIRLPAPFDGPDADVPVDPYVLGAWLGDGTSRSGQIASATSTSCTDKDGLSDQEHMITQIGKAGFQATPSVSNAEYLVNTRGLRPQLRTVDVLNNKHIPPIYLRASKDQRLAVLQGLMDTDGHIDANGNCELTLSDERLATDALELIRSLGIKASMKIYGHSYRNPDDPEGVRREAKDRHRINFTTTLPVFRLPRKAERLPTEVKDTVKWLYITDITPAPSEPARCITVDAEDSVWLVGGFVPTHNTIATEWLAYQWVNMGRPVIFVNPKQEDDLSPFAEACGGNVVWLDRLMSVDGVLDPFRYAEGENSSALALAFIAASNPFGSRELLFEVEPRLSAALRFGGDQGARCVGEALDIAVNAGRLDADIRDRIFEVADSQPLFRLGCGRTPTSEPLRASEGLTLIQMGSTNLDLPAPGFRPENLSQRVSVAALRLLVFGAAYALRRRKGVLIFDEAWTFFSGDAGGEMDRLGRLAASQDFLPVALTQKVTDITSAGMHNYVSRVLALALPRDEAYAACQMLGVEPTDARIGAFTADPEFDYSLKAHIEKGTRRVLRPARCFYRDLDGRVTQVRIEIPPDMVTEFSTNPEDRRRRAERLELTAGEQGSQ
jgi:hypothetical protein